ncbi:hypothetical protein [uncultured Aquimarina sp.]|uniref:hypothetical protein n=1 Tax=uncultured Aquimarina sp. TaxID=575652 RepID=UPI00262F4DF3|nr:hypothetical protein [uncultured Aquimarina sp.]
MKYSFFFIFFISLSLIAQRKQKNKFPPDMDINAILENDSYIDQLQKFDSEPVYHLKIKTLYGYQIFINEIPVVSKNNNTSSSIWYPINNSLLKNKNQTLSIVIYPRYISDNLQNETLENDIPFRLEIEESFWVDDDMSEPVSTLAYELPKQNENGQKIDFSELKFYKESLSFQTKIPYQISEWENSKVFKEKDSTYLTEQVLSFYTKLKRDFESQKGEDYVSSVSKGMFNLFKSNYFTKEEASKRFQNKIDFINKKKRELASIENFKLEISGGGRLLSLKRMDGFNKREGVLRRYYTKNGVKKVQIKDILIHMPKDKNQFEVLWYYNIVRSVED